MVLQALDSSLVFRVGFSTSRSSEIGDFSRAAIDEMPFEANIHVIPKAYTYIPVLVGNLDCELGVPFGTKTLAVIKYQISDMDVSIWKVLKIENKANKRVTM